MATSQTSKQEELVAQQRPSNARGGVRADLLTDEMLKIELAHEETNPVALILQGAGAKI